MADTATSSSAVTAALLQSYEGKSIEDICPNCFEYSDSLNTKQPEKSQWKKENHCAHFVSHVLGIRVGSRCSGQFWDTRKADGVSKRVDEVFHACPRRAKLVEQPDGNAEAPPDDPCLVFTCLATYVAAVKDKSPLKMRAGAVKHIGIYLKGQVWQYGNTHRAVKAITLKNFHRIYGKNPPKGPEKYSTFWGSFPDGVIPTSFAVHSAVCSTVNAERKKTYDRELQKLTAKQSKAAAAP